MRLGARRDSGVGISYIFDAIADIMGLAHPHDFPHQWQLLRTYQAFRYYLQMAEWSNQVIQNIFDLQL